MADDVLHEVAKAAGVDVEEALDAAEGNANVALNRLLDGGRRETPALAVEKEEKKGGGESRGTESRKGAGGEAAVGRKRTKQASLESFFGRGSKSVKISSSESFQASKRSADVVVKGSLEEAVDVQRKTVPDGGTSVSSKLVQDLQNGADGHEAAAAATVGQPRAAVAKETENVPSVGGGTARGAQGKSSLTRPPPLPAGKEYDPFDDAWWAVGEPTPYLHLARTFEIVSKTSSRLRTLDLLCNMLRSILRRRPEDIFATLYLSSNHLAPAWEGVELGMGGHVLAQALREATGASRAALSHAFQRLGDMGDIALELKVGVRTINEPTPLSVARVYETLRAVAKDKGAGSVARKKVLVKKLFVACKDTEIRWIVRTLAQHLRIGAVTKTFLSAITRAVVIERENGENIEEATAAVVEAYSRCPSFDVICEALLSEGSWRRCAAACDVRPGIPMKPQLGRITRDPGALLKRFGESKVTCELKYDGQRAQIHIIEGGSVRVFSRHLEDVTGRYGEIVPACLRAAESRGVRSAVLDAEVVAVDRGNNNKLLPFQTLTQRSKKLDVCLMVFDCLYLNGETLLRRTLAERREILETSFTFVPGEFARVEAKTTSDEAEVREYLDKAVNLGGEGLMCKALEGPLSTYEPNIRSDGWAKIKKDYVDGLTGTLDLVPIAAWWGNGRKAGWLSPFLLACYHDGEFQSLCKVMSGYSDKQYKELTAFYKDGRMLARKPGHYIVNDALAPSVWLEACGVWEIKGADFTLSPVHSAAIGIVDEGRGASLRFPRFIGFREDKTIEDATSADEVADMYRSQVILNRDDGADMGPDMDAGFKEVNEVEEVEDTDS